MIRDLWLDEQQTVLKTRRIMGKKSSMKIIFLIFIHVEAVEKVARVGKKVAFNLENWKVIM